MLERHWDAAHGYSAPNRSRYRWQWLWDSCFHAIVWAALGDERGVTELRSVFAMQSPSGFVPHLGYQAAPEEARSLWGRTGASTITQPPMWGHAMAVLFAHGHRVDPLVPAATAGLRFLLEHRRSPDGLLRIVHPWESGTDDSARWDAYCPGGFERTRWLRWKLGAVGSLQHLPSGGAVRNPAFEVCPASFNALVAFNCLELGTLANDDGLAAAGRALAEQVAEQWSHDARTWVDREPSDQHDGGTGRADGGPDLVVPGAADTLDAQLAVLVDHGAGRMDDVVTAVTADARFGAPFGPCALSRSHPAFDPVSYWRGPSWPQLTYLLWVAMSRAGRHTEAAALAAQLLRTTVRSGFAEYVDPLTGAGLGAVPQSWSGLCIVPVAWIGPGTAPEPLVAPTSSEP